MRPSGSDLDRHEPAVLQLVALHEHLRAGWVRDERDRALAPEEGRVAAAVVRLEQRLEARGVLVLVRDLRAEEALAVVIGQHRVHLGEIRVDGERAVHRLQPVRLAERGVPREPGRLVLERPARALQIDRVEGPRRAERRLRLAPEPRRPLAQGGDRRLEGSRALEQLERLLAPPGPVEEGDDVLRERGGVGVAIGDRALHRPLADGDELGRHRGLAARDLLERRRHLGPADLDEHDAGAPVEGGRPASRW